MLTILTDAEGIALWQRGLAHIEGNTLTPKEAVYRWNRIGQHWIGHTQEGEAHADDGHHV